MDIENFIAEFKKTFVYDLLSMTLKDEQLFEHMVDGDAVLWFKEQTRQMWLMWEKAKVQAVPEGFVLVKMEDLELLRDSALEIKYASLSSDSDRIFSDIEDIQLSVERLIELQEPTND